MSQPVLVTGAAGGTQGSTGRLVAGLLMEFGVPVRALVHKLDARSDNLHKQGAEVVEGDLLNPASVQAAMKNIRRAYFTYPVADGLLEATAIFASAARDARVEMVVNNSQFQGAPDSPEFGNLQQAPTFRNLQHRLADRVFDWSGVGAVHLQSPPYYENVHALASRSVSEQGAVLLPWGDDSTVIPLIGAEGVSRVAATLLANPGLPSQRAYALISATPTVREIVETLGRALDRPIRYIPITDEQWAGAVKERINAHALDHLTRLWRYFRNSGRGFEVTETVRIVTGRSPETLQEFFMARGHTH